MVRKFAPIAIAFLIVACGGESQDSEFDGTESQPPGSTATNTGLGSGEIGAAEPVMGDPGRVMATVGTAEITLREVDLLAATLQRNRLGSGKAELQKLALDNLIDQQVLLRAAGERGIAPSEADFNSAVAEIQSQFPNTMAFEQAIQQQGMTREDFDTSFRTELTIQKLVEEAFAETVDVTAAEARTYYDANSHEFQMPPTVHARHILIQVDQTAPVEVDSDARARAQAALDRVRGGEDFASVANQVTEDPTNSGRGGDLGFFPREQMVQPFSDAAFALGPGQVSDLVRTQFGYHIIKVEERRDAGLIEFDEVSPHLIQNLEQQATSEGVRAFLEREKARMGIQREM